MSQLIVKVKKKNLKDEVRDTKILLSIGNESRKSNTQVRRKPNGG
jgi:hypothetical protein